MDLTNHIPHSTTCLATKKKRRRKKNTNNGFSQWIPRANKLNNREANEYTPSYGLVHSPASLSVEGDATLVLVKNPGSDRETTGTSSTKRAFSLYINGTLPLQPGSRSIRSLEMGSAHYSNKQARRRTARPTFRQNLTQSKNGDEYRATWWRDAKLIRVP